MPASRRARAIILAPRSWPSRPGFAMTTRILRAIPGEYTSGSDLRAFALVLAQRTPAAKPLAPEDREGQPEDERDQHSDRHEHVRDRDPRGRRLYALRRRRPRF